MNYYTYVSHLGFSANQKPGKGIQDDRYMYEYYYLYICRPSWMWDSYCTNGAP